MAPLRPAVTVSPVHSVMSPKHSPREKSGSNKSLWATSRYNKANGSMNIFDSYYNKL